MLSIVLLRHGKTEGNLYGRYNSRTDEPLCAEGIAGAEAARHFPEISLVYASPMQRAQQTARICYPNAQIVTIPDLREMDFGDFEGRTADEMEHDADYRAWVAGGCVDVCPNGEGIPDFAKRAATAFAGAVADAEVEHPLVGGHRLRLGGHRPVERDQSHHGDRERRRRPSHPHFAPPAKSFDVRTVGD